MEEIGLQTSEQMEKNEKCATRKELVGGLLPSFTGIVSVQLKAYLNFK